LVSPRSEDMTRVVPLRSNVVPTVIVLPVRVVAPVSVTVPPVRTTGALDVTNDPVDAEELFQTLSVRDIE
jgi:hypothetical protein